MKNNKENFKLWTIGAVSGLINGILGTGGGMIVVPALEKIVKADVKTAHATAISIILPLSIVSAFFYIGRGQTNWKILTLVSVFGVLGSIIGAKLLAKLKSKQIQIIFYVLMIILGVRQIWV